MKKSLYIHIPFCARKCIYCDFYSIGGKNGLANSYIDALISQIKALDEAFYTIYIGGGTPSSLNDKLLKKLLAALKKVSGNCAEFTLEVNPESFSREKAKILLDYGVNRLSLGIQSFRDDKLKALGRIHNSSRALKAIYLALQNGISNINIDLIFGIWGETIKDWKRELETAVTLPVKHISCYSLTYERNTELFKRLKTKAITQLPDNLCADMYKLTMEYLPKNKFIQYEISNFSRRGFECKHNLNYWENNPYLGLGASAASFLNGVRSKNISDVAEYTKLIRKGKSVIVSFEKLSAVKSARETAAIKIRTKKGIDFNWFKEKTDFDFLALEKDSLQLLVKERFLKYTIKGGRCTGITATRKGFLFCDYVSAQLL